MISIIFYRIIAKRPSIPMQSKAILEYLPVTGSDNFPSFIAQILSRTGRYP